MRLSIILKYKNYDDDDHDFLYPIFELLPYQLIEDMTL